MTEDIRYIDKQCPLTERQFFAILKLAFGQPMDNCLQVCWIDWKAIYQLAEKQSIVGLCFAGVERMPKDRLPDMDLLMDWLGQTEYIKSQNEHVSATVGKVRTHFEELGMQMVLLKGQGNGVYYNDDANLNPNLALLRTPGDIDAWVFLKDIEHATIEELMRNDETVLKWLWKRDPERRHCYIHTDYPDMDGVSVEMHFRPSYLNSPRRNKLLQRWFAEMMDGEAWEEVTLPNSDVKVQIPTTKFNLVYQLTHLYRHIFDDGLGLRQVIDFFMLLRAFNSNLNDNPNPNLRAQEKVEIVQRIKEFGMYNFACALMYVMRETLGMKEEELLCPVDEKRGQFLLQEIMLAGNFGHHDERNIHFKHDNGVTRLLRRQWRNMRFIFDYPEEVLSVPVYRVYQEVWRWKMGKICR